ncbi:MAG: ABC transporter substrate-binding protein [Alphaproteobacteria bacterium]
MTRISKKMRWLGAAALAGALVGSTAMATAAEMKKVAISTIVEVSALVDVKNGIIKGLEDNGFKVGTNLEIDYQNANGNMPTQQQIAKKFVGSSPDVIVAITTPTAQAMAAVTKDIPIVFAAVTNPIKAKLISQYIKPGGNITGASDAAPYGPQLDLFKEILPGLKKLGFIYNPGLDNSLSALARMKEEGATRGIEIVESVAPTTNEIIVAARKLVGKVDAIYIPNDTTVVSAIEAIVKIGREAKVPVLSGETGGVKRGTIASLGFDYYQGGLLAGAMAAKILNGTKAGDIDAVAMAQVLKKFDVHLNKITADATGVVIPAAVLAKASKIYK